MEINLKGCLAALMTAGALSACASAPTNKPDDAISRADYAINQAQDDNAKQYAPLPLYNAGKKLSQAQKLAKKEDATSQDYERAKRLAYQAALDAQLAQAQTRNKQAQAHAEDVQKSVQTLKQELDRKESGQ